MLGVNFIGRKFQVGEKSKQHQLTHYLPYNFFVGKRDEGILFLKPGALMRTYTFTCPDLGSASTEHIASIAACFNEAVRRLGSGWAIHFEARRDVTTEYPGSNWDNILGYLIDSRRKENYKSKENHYISTYFLTLTSTVKSDIMSKGSGLLYKKTGYDDDYYNTEGVKKEIDLFRDLTEEFISYVSARLPITPLNNDNLMTYIHSAISTKKEQRRAPETPMMIDRYLSEADVDTGMCMKIGNLWCPIVEVREFPISTTPAMFDVLNQAGIEYRWITRWIAMDKAISAKVIEKSQKQFHNSRKGWGQLFMETAAGVETDREDPTARDFEADTDAARIELARDMASFGYFTACVEVWDKDYDTAIEKATYVAGLINSTGFGAKLSGVNSFSAWRGTLPGEAYHNLHKELVSSANATHIIPLSACWTGNFYNKWTSEHIGCSAPLLTASSNSSPFFLNLNVGDVFHTVVLGPSGAGKSTLLCLLESQFLKYPNSRIAVIDKDKTARGVCMAAGGSYAEPGMDATAFQPLRDIDSEGDLMWGVEFIELCLSEQKVSSNATRSEAIRQALVQLRDTKEPQGRDLTTFQQYVQDDEVRAGIQPYTLDGQYGSIFDARATKLATSRFSIIEMGTLMRMGEACVTPALMYLFRLIESMFADANDSNGHPTLLVMDEAWVYLANEYFARRIDDWLRTLRKKRVAVVFATQDVVNMAKTSIAATIVSQCQTKFFLADPNAQSELLSDDYVTFGLEPSEIASIATARMKRDYLYKSPLGTRMMQLDLDKYQLALLCPPSSVLDTMERRYGRNSGKPLAVEILKAQGIDPMYV